MPYPPASTSTIYSGSTDTIISCPISKHKKPGRIKTLVTGDRYWEKYTIEVIKEADAAVQKAERTKKLPITEREEHRIDGYIEDITTAQENYARFRTLKKPAKARISVGFMQESTISLNETRTKSKIHARRLLEGYAMFSQAKNDEWNMLGPWRHIPPCTIGLRRTPLERVIAWFESGHRGKRVHWLSGKRRCGKSAILHHIARKYDKLFPEGRRATVEFSGRITRKDFVDTFLATLLDQLAERDRQVKIILSQIGHSLRNDRYFSVTPMDKQIDTVFINTLSQLQAQSPFLIFVDGLDACDAGAVDALFDFIEHALSSPLPIYFIIASSDARALSVMSSISRAGLKGFVDTNEVIPYEDAIQEGIKEGLVALVNPPVQSSSDTSSDSPSDVNLDADE
ncbi:hypothetical protein DFP72DRAFT_390579 [Ephemerocybe angulata]|uniref:Nephrocystin 3-like N-terminal domain-containing protein n=1 Tax=Ephemerocybe angulata TaxID=980116 RepID=A0A8H6M6P4_9AGAR|nr:hypothetical protein DFP72DRAFT_390579 [Tulosesus angulatus]